MLIVALLWLAFTIIVAVVANTRGRDAIGWFLLAAVVSPLIAGLLLLALPRLDDPYNGGPVRLSPEAEQHRATISWPVLVWAAITVIFVSAVGCLTAALI
jgi:hypothetical protein